MKRTFLAVAAALTIGMSGAAVAAPIFLIDDFTSSPPNDFFATLTAAGQVAYDNNEGNAAIPGSPETYNLGGNNFARWIKFEREANAPSGPVIGSAALSVSDGYLGITNGAGIRSKLTMTYDVTSLGSQVGANNLVNLAVVFSDGTSTNMGPTSIDVYINGTLFGNWIDTQGVSEPDDYQFAGWQLSSNAFTGTNDILEFVVNGPYGYDFTIDEITLAVPEPAMLGLFGLGAIGLGLARRRKK